MKTKTKISKSFTVEDWINLRSKLFLGDKTDWDQAIKVFSDRIESRFLEPIHRIKKQDLKNGEGFSIALISVVLLEFIAAFELGKIYEPDSSNSGPHQYSYSSRLFSSFFSGIDRFKNGFQNRDCRDKFYHDIRCGLVHEARTKGVSVIISEESIKNTKPEYFYFKDNNELRLNRDSLLKTIEEHINEYCSQLRNDLNQDIRRKFIMKMDELAGLKHVWYFIYGSNLLRKRLSERLENIGCDYLFKSNVTLPDYRFRYNKLSIDNTAKANIEYSEGDKVEGISVLLLENEVREFGMKYEKGYALIECTLNPTSDNQEGNAYKALTFLSDNLTSVKPSKTYVDYVLNGAAENGLTQNYINGTLKMEAV